MNKEALIYALRSLQLCLSELHKSVASIEHAVENHLFKGDEDIFKRDISTLNVSVRICNVCYDDGIHTIGQLVLLREGDLLSYPNFGRKSLKLLIQALAELGLRLGMAEEKVNQ